MQRESGDVWSEKVCVFIIPVVARARAQNWRTVEENLARTVGSVLNSEDPRLAVLIAHDDRPEGSYWSEERVVSVQLPQSNLQPPPSTVQPFARVKTDKCTKIKTAAHWWREYRRDSAYVMLLDADDLVSRSLVGFVLSHDSRGSYEIPVGYRFDLEQHFVRPVIGRFPGICGTCFIGHFTAAELPTSPSDTGSVFSRICDARHEHHGKVAASLGKPVTAVPFPAVVYVLNHVNSAEDARVGRRRRVRGGLWRNPGLGRYVLAKDFGVDLLPGVPRGPATGSSTARIQYGVMHLWIRAVMRLKGLAAAGSGAERARGVERSPAC